ncbi:hypothetical protein BDY24DRAFT_229598 [Mrakia frigida]|uniref:uncharacterized protein n=1 Tax=Mrakia frigida TaxID=29902 RepID=UPI003FCBF8E6
MAPTDDKKKDTASTKSTKEELTSEPTTKEEDKPKVVVPITLQQELRLNLSLIDRAVSSFEPRFAQRVLRTLTTLRKKLNKQEDGVEVLKQVMKENYPKSEYESDEGQGRGEKERKEVEGGRRDEEMESVELAWDGTSRAKEKVWGGLGDSGVLDAT